MEESIVCDTYNNERNRERVARSLERQYWKETINLSKKVDYQMNPSETLLKKLAVGR